MYLKVFINTFLKYLLFILKYFFYQESTQIRILNSFQKTHRYLYLNTFKKYLLQYCNTGLLYYKNLLSILINSLLYI